MEDARPGLDWARAQLRAREVALHAAGPAHLSLGSSEVIYHAPPGLGVVMCAVDPHDVHPGRDEVAD